MDPNCYNYDKKIKEGLDALASEVPVPDVVKAFDRHKRRREKKTWHYGVAVAAAILMFFIVGTASGPTQAFRGLVMETTSTMLTETSQLFQRSPSSENGVVEVIDDFKIKEIDTLSELKKEQDVSMFLPSDLDEDNFVFAEVVYSSNRLSSFEVEFVYSQEELLYMVLPTTTHARTFGTSVEMETVMVHDIEVLTFSHNQGWTLIEWHDGYYLHELSGNKDAEELLDIVLSQGLLN
ncbi:hypothetical protein [Dethiobacter alkaliphilus]|uniref:DUF4367 domain-containing protein n=1 Tax=Dethiobacter alkaliphilus AHT 1 TaxID=555088 RepID=C0GI25_DETAL|nr:hypothetical protein [Dethiobacter alkaliphilus]EEG77099.1 hypothetical protein DealDRAFT_2134 [Dethiobacter alkaliphilus AHT 1]